MPLPHVASPLLSQLGYHLSSVLLPSADTYYVTLYNIQLYNTVEKRAQRRDHFHNFGILNLDKRSESVAHVQTLAGAHACNHHERNDFCFATKNPTQHTSTEKFISIASCSGVVQHHKCLHACVIQRLSGSSTARRPPP